MMRAGSTITTEVQVTDSRILPALESVNQLYGRVRRNYFRDRYVKKVDVNLLKSTYIKKFGISARFYNSIKSDIDGLVKANREIQGNLIDSLQEKIRATENTIKKLASKRKELKSNIKSIETFRDKASKWRDNNLVGKKPKLSAKISGLDLATLRKDFKKNKFKHHQKKRRLSLLQHRL